MSLVNPGRLAAVRALIQIDRGAHADDALAVLVPPDPADRGLAWHLVLGVLRRRGALDALIEQLAKRKISSLDPAPLAALRVGLYEILLSRTATHAAVDQAVEACRAAGGGRASGFVNAILRKGSTAQLSDDPWLDLPPWLRERFAGYGAWIARCRDAAPLCGVVRPGDPLPEGLAVAPAMAGGQVVPDTFVVQDPRGQVERLPGFADGRWWVMDPASVAVADLVLDALGQGRGARVLDACSAPGGKSFRLATRGASVLAVDHSAARLARLREGAARLKLEIPTRQHDWLDGPMPGAEQFDAVLVDAPCTGLGTVRRHPEIRWLRLPSDPAAMALRQLPILRAAATHVAPGGALIYAVCSPMPEEGPGVVSELTGWAVERAWSSVPPTGDEDAFQAFVLRQRR